MVNGIVCGQWDRVVNGIVWVVNGIVCGQWDSVWSMG